MIQTQAWIYHPTQGQQLASVMQEIKIQPHLAQSLSDFDVLNLALGGLWVLYDQGQETLDLCSRIRAQSKSTFWGILIVGQSQEQQQKVFLDQGADRYLAYPFERTQFTQHLQGLIDERTPISLYNILPPKLAQAIDKLSIRLDQLNYFGLLELTPKASPQEIQDRFHQRSLVLHPDRHRKLKKTHPQIYTKVNQIYKHLVEAYRILSHPDKNQLYQLMCSEGLVRWNEQKAQEYSKMSSLSDSPHVQKELLKVLMLRRQGQLFQAYQCLQTLIDQEPHQEQLQLLLSHYHKLIEIIRRDPTLYQG